MPLNQIKSNLVDMVLTRHTPLSMTAICKNLSFFLCPFRGGGPIVRRPISPTAHLSDNPLVRQPISKTAHYSDNPLVQHVSSSRWGTIFYIALQFLLLVSFSGLVSFLVIVVPIFMEVFRMSISWKIEKLYAGVVHTCVHACLITFWVS
jgi:hypothetical protein